MLFKKTVFPKALLGVWEISESLDFLKAGLALDDSEKRKLATIKNEVKQQQWLSSRYLLKEISGRDDLKIAYLQNGKPYLEKPPYKISISHTQNYAAIILEDQETGIDIQYMDPKIERIVHKFMSEEELKSLVNTNRLEQLFIYWCAKEALCKMTGNKQIFFKENLFIEPFKYEVKGKIVGRIKENSVKSYTLEYEKIAEDIMLVYLLNS